MDKQADIQDSVSQSMGLRLSKRGKLCVGVICVIQSNSCNSHSLSSLHHTSQCLVFSDWALGGIIRQAQNLPRVVKVLQNAGIQALVTLA